MPSNKPVWAARPASVSFAPWRKHGLMDLLALVPAADIAGAAKALGLDPKR
jgi:hypothetical protein